MKDVICALASAEGTAGIAVIRVSGSGAYDTSRKIAPFLPEFSKAESHRLYYGWAKSLLGSQPIDEVLVSYFEMGRSFTGQESVEISCHGSPQVSRMIIQELVSAGARVSRPGEFTFRAFMNGRIDLAQAEGILSLIQSQSELAHRISVRHLRGEFSGIIREIEDSLLWILAHLEANIDFSTEDIEVSSAGELRERTVQVRDRVEELLGSYRTGKVIREGLRVALLGAPNVGKSSLLNRLAKEERAIVSEIPGTTRDVVEARLRIDGIEIVLQDTAGFQDTENVIEKTGIERSKRAATESDLVFWVVDSSLEPTGRSLMGEVLSKSPEDVVIVTNKIDLFAGQDSNKSPDEIPEGMKQISVSAKTGEGCDLLLKFLRDRVRSLTSEHSSPLLQSRHHEALCEVSKRLMEALSLLDRKESPEFVAFELQVALRRVFEITGKEVDEAVLDKVFKEFCLGK